MDCSMGRLLCPSLSPRVCSGSCPLTWWCYLIISSSAATFFAFNLSKHQDLFHWVGYLPQVFKVLEHQHHSLHDSLQFSCSVMPKSLRPHEPQHARPPGPSTTPRVHPNPCPLSRWCHPTVSFSVVPFSTCPQSFPRIRVFSNESVICIR